MSETGGACTTIRYGSSGVPISIVPRNEFARWVAAQPDRVRRWLETTGFVGDGLRLVPNAGGELHRVVLGVEDVDVFHLCGGLANELPPGEYTLETDANLLKRAAISWGMASYGFNRYRKVEKNADATLHIGTRKLFSEVQIVLRAMNRIRDLINTPSADMMPQDLAADADALARKYGAKTTHVVGEELLESNYPAIHAVGRASVHAPRLIDLQWGDLAHPRITLVGKGVCFDSGGLNLKPASGMRLMKKDMGGAAHVLGLAELVMAHRLPVRLRVMIPAVENALSGNALHPGDVVKTRKGLSVEVDNTDAEGRLILCDALAEADSERPELLVDFATLTGHCRIALGTELPGVFTNRTSVGSELVDIGDQVDDPLWQMPLYRPYRDLLKSSIADVSSRNPENHAGAITAALYLEHFISEQTPWVHIDFTAWNDRERPGRAVGGYPQAVRAVFSYLQRKYSR